MGRGKPIHGHTSRALKNCETPEYRAFLDAKQRCINPKNRSYYNYGGRGIEFRFESFAQFIEHIGLKPTPAHTLDRTNNNSHYELGNVRWATRSEQLKNRRPYKNEKVVCHIDNMAPDLQDAIA